MKKTFFTAIVLMLLAGFIFNACDSDPENKDDGKFDIIVNQPGGGSSFLVTVGSDAPTAGSTKALPDAQVILTPIPQGSSSVFMGWDTIPSPQELDIAGPDENGNYDFYMPASEVTIGAFFSDYYTVTIGEYANGTITVQPANATTTGVISGTPITIRPAPAAGYELDPDALSTTPSRDITPAAGGNYTFEMGSSNVTINATFRARNYRINKGAVVGGDLEFSATEALAGTEITITVTVNDNYIFNRFNPTPATLVITDNKFIMPTSDVTIGASFNPQATSKLPTPVSQFLQVVSGSGALEFDRAGGAAGGSMNDRLILGGQSDGPSKNTYDGLNGRGPEVAEARIYGFQSAADAAAGTNEVSYFVFRGKDLYSPDGSAVYDIVANGGGGAGYNWPGNWYLQDNLQPAMFAALMGASPSGSYWLRPKYIASGDNREFDSDFGTTRSHANW